MSSDFQICQVCQELTCECDTPTYPEPEAARPYFEIKAYTSGDAVLELVTPIKVIA